MNTTEPGEPSRKSALAWGALYLALFSVLAFGVFAGLRLRCEALAASAWASTGSPGAAPTA